MAEWLIHDPEHQTDDSFNSKMSVYELCICAAEVSTGVYELCDLR